MKEPKARPRRRHAVIVDDERLARRELRKLLEEAHSEVVRIVGEAATVAEAARVVEATDADLVFLDITLRRESGFDLLPQLGNDVSVVFVSAHSVFALRAFEVNALDYLLKPVEPERLARTVERLVQTSYPIEETTLPLSSDDRLFLRLDGARAFIKVGDIIAIRAAGDDSLVHMANRVVPARTAKGLGEWELRLPARSFVRIHRSAIINLEYVLRVEEWSHSSHLVYLRGVSDPITMSRRYGARVRGQLG